jgi:hypothetical protein
MKLKAEYIFDADMKRTIDVCVMNNIGNVQYFKDSMPNVSSVKLIERVDHPDGRIHVKMEFCAHGQIPKAIQHIIKPEMLTWREISTWDPNTKRYNFEIKPHFMPNMFSCKGYWGYVERGPNKTAQFVDGVLEIKVPIFGPMIEKAIWPNLEKNWQESYVLTKKANGI